jgi:hypothetical protein
LVDQGESGLPAHWSMLHKYWTTVKHTRGGKKAPSKMEVLLAPGSLASILVSASNCRS